MQKDIAKNCVDSKQFDIHYEDGSVDAIFADADRQMADQNKQAVMLPKNEKKKKRHPILKFIISTLIMLIVAFGALGYLMTRAVKESLPQIKEDLMTQIVEVQDQIKSLDDDELTIDEYYQKQIILLLSPEDIQSAIDDIGNVKDLAKLFGSDGEIDVSVIPEEKIEEYNKLIEEYQKAIEENETEYKTSTEASSES